MQGVKFLPFYFNSFYGLLIFFLFIITPSLYLETVHQVIPPLCQFTFFLTSTVILLILCIRNIEILKIEDYQNQ